MPWCAPGDCSSCFIATDSSGYGWSKSTDPNQRSGLLTMLSPLEHGLQHAEIQEGRTKGVGEWLTQSEEFKRWSGFEGEGGGDEAVLFCYGGPGVGKTFISSLVVDRLRDQARGQNTAVTSFYFDFAVRKELTATAMLGSMVKQMINEMEVIPEDISRGLKGQIRNFYGYEPQLVDILKILQLITSSQSTIMCIDGLDGCLRAERVRILDSLKDILERSPATRIFVTGRPEIQTEIEERLAGRVISLPVGPSKEDIITYLRARLAEDEISDAMDEGLEADILEKIPENISGMFLLASLSIESVLHETTINQRGYWLGKMTDGLGLEDAYGAAIERIKAQGENESRLGMAALMWISHAERPLTADELCHALAIKLGSTDVDADNVPSILTLLGCCQGLITVDKEPSTVRLLHSTLQEYISIRSDIFIKPHSAIAETCLTYLNLEKVKALSTDTSPGAQYYVFLERCQKIPFLEYCSLNWGIHAKKELSDCSRLLALQMFQEYDGHISVKLLLQRRTSLRIMRFLAGSKFSGLECASFFGIMELVTAVIEMGCYDINKGHWWGYTPLIWAAHNGHEEVVKILLDARASPDKADKDRETPLSHAARKGHDGVVKILLERYEVNPNHRGDCHITPLMHAAKNGNWNVVKLLLKRKEINPDQIYSCQTPLAYAAQAGHEGVVKTLLKRKEVIPDRPCNDRRPLSYAAQNGHEGVVKMLLQQQAVCPDKPCRQYGRTPLSYAAERGHEGVVERLLEREDVNPDKSDRSGRTPLSYAAWCGRKEVVKMLLSQEGVNPDKSSYDGRTPLSYAAQKGYEGVGKILLEQEEVNPDTSDNQAKTPFLYATLNGHLGMVERLLGREDVDPNRPDHTGKAPLEYAARKGNVEMVKILLRRSDVDASKQSNYGSTPLFQAASRGYEDIVKALLERKEVNPDSQNNNGTTPLWMAASNGHEGLVKMLLGRKEVNPDRQDNEGKTPLFVAATQGHDGVVKMLLGRQEVNPDKPDDQGQTPLISAQKKGHKRVIRLLEPQEAVESKPKVKRRRHRLKAVKE